MDIEYQRSWWPKVSEPSQKDEEEEPKERVWNSRKMPKKGTGAVLSGSGLTRPENWNPV